MSEIDWAAKFRTKHAKILTQAPPDPPKPADVTSGWRTRVEQMRQALRDCNHDGSRTHNDMGDAWCSRCGARLP
jgi:hypothetical protein